MSKVVDGSVIEAVIIKFRDGSTKELPLEEVAKINDMTDFCMEFAIIVLKAARIARGKGRGLDSGIPPPPYPLGRLR